MSEKVGKHKGAVETLMHEKKELSRLLQIVNSQLERHLSALEEKGIDTDQFIQKIQQQGNQNQKQSNNSRSGNRNEEIKRREQKSQNSQRKRNTSDRRKSRGSRSKDDSADSLEGDEEDERDFSPL